jgi:hypothetical protein
MNRLIELLMNRLIEPTMNRSAINRVAIKQPCDETTLR